MRIQVYPRVDGRSQVLVIPGRRAHMPPIALGPATRDVLRQALGPVIEAVGEGEVAPPSTPPAV